MESGDFTSLSTSQRFLTLGRGLVKAGLDVNNCPLHFLSVPMLICKRSIHL